MNRELIIRDFEKLINNFNVKYHGCVITIIGNRFIALNKEFPTLQEAKAYIDKPIKLKIA